MRTCFAVFLSLALTSAAHARTLEDVSMPDSVSVGGKKLVLNGMGIREATVFKVNVYVAGLYLEKKTSYPSAVLKDGTKRLKLEFVRSVDKDDLTDAWEDGFKKNGNYGKLSAKVKQLNGWMAGMKPGQTLTMTYETGKGTTISVRGKAKGTIQGADFAKTLWKIFVGPNPPNEGLKQGLLGNG